VAHSSSLVQAAPAAAAAAVCRLVPVQALELAPSSGGCAAAALPSPAHRRAPSPASAPSHARALRTLPGVALRQLRGRW
jgi:hypothetical protein